MKVLHTRIFFEGLKLIFKNITINDNLSSEYRNQKTQTPTNLHILMLTTYILIYSDAAVPIYSLSKTVSQTVICPQVPLSVEDVVSLGTHSSPVKLYSFRKS